MAALAEFIHDNIRVLGSSLAGEETFLILPEMNLAFDVGRAPRELITIDHLFLTHGHMDHAAALAYYCAQREFIDNAPAKVWMPEALLDPVQRLLRVWADIDGHEPPAQLYAATPGVDVPLRRDLVVRPFGVNHPSKRRDRRTVQALGYCAIDVRQKLKTEYEGFSGPQIVEAKRRGEEVTRRMEAPLVCFCGDTAPGDFLDLDFVRRSKVLLLECTFLDADHRDRARAGGHFHVDDLREALPHLENERIILTHLSRRTALGEAKALLRAAIGDELGKRVFLLMEHRRRSSRIREQQEQSGAANTVNDRGRE